MKGNNFSLKDHNIEISNFLDRGGLVYYYRIGDDIIGIRSLTLKDFGDISLYYKGKQYNEFYNTSEAPIIFAKHFLYSINSVILDKNQISEIIDNLCYELVLKLFKCWKELQEYIEVLEKNLEKYVQSFESRLKFKLCKFFQVTPNDPKIQEMDRISQIWLYRNIIEDERELNDILYEKIEYLVGFVDGKAAKQAYNYRQEQRGKQPSSYDPHKIKNTQFDSDLLEYLSQNDPNFDPDKVRGLDDYVNYVQRNDEFSEAVDNAYNNPEQSKAIAEYERQKFIDYLSRQKGCPLTEKEADLAISKLDDGQFIDLNQILEEAAEFLENNPVVEIPDDLDLDLG